MVGADLEEADFEEGEFGREVVGIEQNLFSGRQTALFAGVDGVLQTLNGAFVVVITAFVSG